MDPKVGSARVRCSRFQPLLAAVHVGGCRSATIVRPKRARRRWRRSGTASSAPCGWRPRRLRRFDPIRRRLPASGVDRRSSTWSRSCKPRRRCRSFCSPSQRVPSPTTAAARRHAGRTGLHAARLGDADRARLSGPGHAVAAPGLHVSDRMRRRAPRTGLAIFGRGHGAALRSAHRGRPQQHGVQSRPERRPGPGRDDRRGRGRPPPRLR